LEREDLPDLLPDLEDWEDVGLCPLQDMEDLWAEFLKDKFSPPNKDPNPLEQFQEELLNLKKNLTMF
jgi:hypothetical protein